jgi:DNA-binding MltR family transcriptional regulator
MSRKTSRAAKIRKLRALAQSPNKHEAKRERALAQSPNKHEAKRELEQRGINLDQLLRDTHAGVALVLCSLLDDVFERALRAAMSHLSNIVLNELLTGYGPLSRLSAKIEIAYGMKLVTAQQCSDARLIRKIRNKFAHVAKRLDFGSKEIVQIGAQLSTYDKQKEDVRDAYIKAMDAILTQLYREIEKQQLATALRPRQH